MDKPVLVIFFYFFYYSLLIVTAIFLIRLQIFTEHIKAALYYHPAHYSHVKHQTTIHLFHASEQATQRAGPPYAERWVACLFPTSLKTCHLLCNFLLPQMPRCTHLFLERTPIKTRTRPACPLTCATAARWWMASCTCTHQQRRWTSEVLGVVLWSTRVMCGPKTCAKPVWNDNKPSCGAMNRKSSFRLSTVVNHQSHPIILF